MKAIPKVVGLFCLSLVLPGVLFADVTSIRIRLAGGCTTSNSSSSCTIKATANGSDLRGEQLRLEKSTTGLDGNYDVFGRPRTLSNSGRTEWRFKNDPGRNVCYRAKDLATGVRSREVCIAGRGSTTVTPTPRPGGATPVPTVRPTATPGNNAAVARGQALFTAQCVRCHSAGSLRNTSADEIRNAKMPPNRPISNTNQLNDLAAYLGTV